MEKKNRSERSTLIVTMTRPVCVIALLGLFTRLGFVSCDYLESDVTMPVRIGQDRRIFQVKAFGDVFTLHLRLDDSFVSPTLHVQRVTSKRVLEDVRPEPGTGQDLRDCFHSGTVNGDERSLVSVSLCRGIQGTFVTRGNEFFIEPVRGASARANASVTDAHVVRRRVLTGDTVRETDDDDDEDEDDEELERRREKRFVSAARYIETLVVADTSMTRFYGDDIKVKSPFYARVNVRQNVSKTPSDHTCTVLDVLHLK